MNSIQSSTPPKTPLPRRIAYSVGFAVMLTGLAHLIAYPFLENATWSGPLGLRKPIVFGLSAGFTLATLGWLLKFFPPKPRLYTAITAAASGALLLEIAIINIQHFRGLPSHFNVGTPFDTTLWSIMGLSIYCFSLAASTLAVLSFGKLNGTPAMRLAIRASMLLFFFSQISGQLIVFHGMNHVLQNGTFIMENVATSTTIDQAGNLKLPHALSLHSIQVLPMLALMLIGLDLNKRQQEILVWTSAAGFAGITLLAQIHAYSGRSIFDLDAGKAVIMLLSSVALLTPFIFATTALALRLAKEDSPRPATLKQSLST